MITLITGGSGSGKSAYAEDYIGSLGEASTIYYIATMQVRDGESEERVRRHRRMRAGRGFVTIEQPKDLKQAAEQIEAGGCALLECMSNLAANEMFDSCCRKTEKEVATAILEGIRTLHKKLRHLVIVTNTIFEDGAIYEEATMSYLRAVGEINRETAAMADAVIEVVAGIPILIKGGRET